MIGCQRRPQTRQRREPRNRKASFVGNRNNKTKRKCKTKNKPRGPIVMKREHLLKFKIIRSYIKNLIDLKKIPRKADQKEIDKKARQIQENKMCKMPIV